MERSKEDQAHVDEIQALVNLARHDGLEAGEVLFASGCRLDPYPYGKTKDQFMAIIEAQANELAKTRNFLTTEHAARISEVFAITMDRHHELKPDCPVCTFLAETSSVKP